MSFFSKIGRSIVYHTTKKPSHYVHVDKPKSVQDLRQIQYNNWCKSKGVYNGSYLPSNPNKLYKKGWNHYDNPNYKHPERKQEFIRKSSGQIVRFDAAKVNSKTGIKEDEHYQWYHDSTRTGYGASLNNRYGKECKAKSPESHLAPLEMIMITESDSVNI